ncbi:MAG: O-antigen ligase family protein [Pseudomonadota bacterium]|nr:O-antigen ligase family protein [Pseudomonadota bacterium]
MGWSERIGLFGAYLFAFFALLGISPATLGLGLVLLTFLLRFRDWSALGRDPVILACLAFALYVGLHSLIFYFNAPNERLAAAAAETGVDWIKLLLFVPFAYFAAGRADRIGRLLLLMLLGFVIGFLREVDWAAFDAAFFSTRFETYLPAVAFGMFTGLGVLGLFALRHRFLNSTSGPVARGAVLVAWGLLLAILLEGLVLSYSRGSWLAFAIAGLLLLFLEWRAKRRDPSSRVRSGLTTTLLVLLVLVSLAATQLDLVRERVSAESETVSTLLGGDLTQVPSDSVGLRAHALRYALDSWRERPWFGWGAGSSRYFLEHSDRPELMTGPADWMPHLHNAYLEIPFQFGLLGLILAGALLWFLVAAAADACRNAEAPGDLCRYFFVVLVFVAIWNLVDYRLVRHDWRFFWILFAGSAYSFRLRMLIENAARQPEPISPNR